MPRSKTCAKNHPYQTLFFVRTRCVVPFGHHFCCLWMVSTIKTILQHSFDLRPEYHYHCGQGGKLSRPSLFKRNKNSYSPESVILIVTGALEPYLTECKHLVREVRYTWHLQKCMVVSHPWYYAHILCKVLYLSATGGCWDMTDKTLRNIG